MCNVEVKLELGHRAVLKDSVTSEGFTHDWTVFVRGPEGSSIQHFVEKVIFQLHESFPKSKRVIKEPPYQVSESGYACFMMPIEVHFRNKEEPKKVYFEYDLFLRLESPPVNHCRIEKLTFQNPSEDFLRKLIKAGGRVLAGGTAGGAASLHTQVCPPLHSKTDYVETKEGQKQILSHGKGIPQTEKKQNAHSEKKQRGHITKNGNKNTAVESSPFADIFGTPIKTKSPDPSSKSKESKHKEKTRIEKKIAPNQDEESKHREKTKIEKKIIPSQDEDSGNNISHSHNQKHTKSAKSSANSNCSAPPSVNKELKNKEKESHVAETKEVKIAKVPKISDKENRSGQKRQPSPSVQSSDNSTKKHRKTEFSSSTTNSSKSHEVPEKKNESTKLKVKDIKDKKDKHKKEKPISVTTNSSKKEKDKVKSKASHKTSSTSKTDIIKSPKSIIKSPKSIIKSPKQSSQNGKLLDTSSLEKMETDNNEMEDIESKVFNDTRESSPSSSISISSLPPNDTHGPLAVMMEAMEKELLSPMSSDSESPPEVHISDKPELNEEELEINTPKNSCKLELENKVNDVKIEKTTEPSSDIHPKILVQNIEDNNKNKSCGIDPTYLNELLELQKQIMALRDRQLLQRIVDVIEETGQFQVTSSTFDFDLCTLDQNTVKKLQNCLAVK